MTILLYAIQLFCCIDFLSLFLFYNVRKNRMYMRKWRRMKLYIKKKKQLRSFVLVSITPSRKFCQCSAIVSAWATWTVGAPGRLSWAWFTHGGHSGCITTLVFVTSLGMFLQFLFQGVSPVILSCCWRIAHSSLALKMGSRNWSSSGLV